MRLIPNTEWLIQWVPVGIATSGKDDILYKKLCRSERATEVCVTESPKFLSHEYKLPSPLAAVANHVALVCT
jgi:hypothetical protein